MLVPEMRSTGMRFSSNHCSTPMCARPRAPPPSRATPILSRFLGAAGSRVGEASGGWGNVLSDSRKQSAIAAREERENICIGCPGKIQQWLDSTAEATVVEWANSGAELLHPVKPTPGLTGAPVRSAWTDECVRPYANLGRGRAPLPHDP